MKDGALLLASPMLAHEEDLLSTGESQLPEVRLAYLGGYLSHTARLTWAISTCCLYELRRMPSL